MYFKYFTSKCTNYIYCIIHMWPDLRKGVFHTHPICQLWQLITSDWKELLPWILGSGEHHYSWIHGELFRLICYLNTELWSPTFTELDVCGRPLFANPVTYIDYRNLHGGFFVTEHSTRWLLLIALSTGWIVCSWTIYKVTSSSWSLYRVMYL